MSTDPSTGDGAVPGWDDVQRLFFAALELAPQERSDFLKAATESEALRQEVVDMLASEEGPGMAVERLLVEAQAPHPPASPGADAAPKLEGRAVGPYRLLRVLGRGGMGEVYLAERSDEQFKRKVAIKLMGFGGSHRSAELLDRFDQERRLLAQLQHPGIAQLLDAGTLDDGRPYLVMEYVDGPPITEYCDRAKLDVRARQRLFEQVCEVVQFAHSRLVIHRDLKPSNILVVEGEDGEPTVKLLDFGIAKLLEPEALHITGLETRTSARPMTPLFAAPEQFAGEPLTTATDVYALGVLFYLLLTGSPPFDRSGSPADYERRVRTETPRRLTQLLSPANETTEATATLVALRDTTRDRLRRLLSGDLERIALMALHRDPERRYVSAGQLGEDVRRARRGEAIVAQDDTLAYRLRVFVRRNKLPVASAAAAVSSLLLLSVFLALQTARARTAQALAEEESRRSARVTEVLADLLSTADPRQQAVGDQIPVSELLRRIGTAVDRFDDDATLQTDLLSLLGRIHSGRDEGQQALEVLSAAAERHRETSADGPRSESSEAEQLRLDHAVAKAEAAVAGDAGRESLRESLSRHRSFYGDNHPMTARAMTDLARFLEPGEGLPLLDRALEILRSAPGHDVDIARALEQKAGHFKWTGEMERSLNDSRAAIDLFERELGPDHPETLTALHRYSDSLPRDKSLAVLRDLIPRQERVFGSQSASLAASLNTLGEHLIRMGEVEEAAGAWQRAVRINTQLYGTESPLVLNSSRNLAMAQGFLGDHQTAAELMTDIESRLPEGERSRAYIGIQAAFMRGRAASSRRDLTREIDRIAEQVATLDRIRGGERDRYPARARGLWVRLLLADARFARAQQEAEAAIDDVSRSLPPEHPIAIELAYLEARARHALLGSSAEAELRDRLARYEALPLHDRFEVTEAKRQLESR